MAHKILVIEDDPDTAAIVEMYLRQEGYQVAVGGDGFEGLRLVGDVKPDLVILDLMLPRLNGLEICRRIRDGSNLPVIMLTARVETEDRLTGFDSGADDYIPKPFHPKEVVARVKAVLRRSLADDLGGAEQVLSRGDIELDLRTYQVTVGGRDVHLTLTEIRLLALFMRHPERVFTREQILVRAFDPETESYDRTIDTHLSNLRRKLGGSVGEGRRLRTIRGVGYMFEP